jgi:hypothetical protein
MRNEIEMEELKHRLALEQIDKKAVLDFSQVAVRGVFLSNGAALIALISFAGTNPDKLKSEYMFWSGLVFVAGVTFSLFAAISAYLSQLRYAWRKDKNQDPCGAFFWRAAGIIFALLSALSFPLGAAISLITLKSA